MKYALALDILVFLLKEGKGMMFSEFVEKQKISSNLYILYDSFGADLYPLKIILNTKENDQLYQIEEKILDFFKNTIINKITDQEIERAARIIGIDYIYSMDDISSRAQFISYAALIKGIKNPGEFLNQYPKLLFTIKKDDNLLIAKNNKNKIIFKIFCIKN